MDELPHSLREMVAEQVSLTIARAKDQCVKDAIRRFTGEDVIDLMTVAPRCERVIQAGVEGETLCMDGVPILWISDLKYREENGVIYTSFDHKMLPEQTDVHPIER